MGLLRGEPTGRCCRPATVAAPPFSPNPLRSGCCGRAGWDLHALPETIKVVEPFGLGLPGGMQGNPEEGGTAWRCSVLAICPACFHDHHGPCPQSAMEEPPGARQASPTAGAPRRRTRRVLEAERCQVTGCDEALTLPYHRVRWSTTGPPPPRPRHASAAAFSRACAPSSDAPLLLLPPFLLLQKYHASISEGLGGQGGGCAPCGREAPSGLAAWRHGSWAPPTTSPSPR